MPNMRTREMMMMADGSDPVETRRTAELVLGAKAAGIGREIMFVRTIAGAARRLFMEALDRTAHPVRRRAARKQLRRMVKVDRVLFVCHGNIYRSPYAEAAFRSQLPERLRERVLALSAGFVGPGRPAPAESMALAEQRGLDLSGHRSQLLTPPLVTQSDLVVVMSGAQQTEICRRFGYPRIRVLVLGDLDPDSIRTREVTDPWNRPVDVLVASTERILRCTGELVRELVGGLKERPGGGE
jgi:protein-tyrosine-phosphatase